MNDKISNSGDDLDYVQDLPGFKPNSPTYFDNDVVDHLLGIVLDMGAELWVVKDRLAFLEETLEKSGVDVVETLDKGRPSDALQAKLKEQRTQMIQRVYGRLYGSYGGGNAEQRAAILENLDVADT
jgi:hypothetical protein